MARLGEVIGAGSRATVHAFGPGRVAKVPLRGTPDRWIRAEAMHTAAVWSTGVRVPELFDLTELDGRTIAVYERIDGPSMWAILRTQPSRADEFGQSLARLHTAILATPPPMAIPAQRDRLLAKVRHAGHSHGTQLAKSAATIGVGSSPLALCHGDLHPGNVLMSESGPVVIDWFDASRGDAAADIARTCLLIGAGGAVAAHVPHLPGATAGLLAALERSYLSAMPTVDINAHLAVQAAARLSEGVSDDELLALWARLTSI